jgi:hypothetical protein
MVNEFRKKMLKRSTVASIILVTAENTLSAEDCFIINDLTLLFWSVVLLIVVQRRKIGVFRGRRKVHIE